MARTEDCEDMGTSSPLLVIEVLSPSTHRYDRGAKSERDAELGILSYWLVDPDLPELEVLELRDGADVEVARGNMLDVQQPFPLRVDLTA